VTDGSAATTIVVVSDDPLIRGEVEYGFPSDVEVLLARDSRGALALMADRAPDVVIVDIQTGSAGGFALAREMSQTDRLRGVPLLMLLERMQDEWLARQAGAAEAIVKPIETGELVGRAMALIASSVR
jgi:DNA-binding response OmpR family regulator